MPMNKPHLEFHKVDMNQGWATPPGYPAGIQQKILASDLDETRGSVPPKHTGLAVRKMSGAIA